MEKDLLELITNQRSSGYIVTLLQIRIKAAQMCPDATFKASNGWTHRFMVRNGLSRRQKTKISQKLPRDLEDKIESFHTFIAILGVRLIDEGKVLYQLSMQYWGCDLYTSATYTRVSTVLKTLLSHITAYKRFLLHLGSCT